VARTLQSRPRMLNSLVRDPRDVPVVRLAGKFLLVLVPPAVLLFVHFHLALAVPYVALILFRWATPFAGLIHEVVHRPLFTRRWLWAGRAAVEWLVCPIFGLAPYLYAAQHVGMHHPENNLAGDASATVGYQRDSVRDFARYFLRFLLLAHWEVLLYLHRARKTRLFRRAAVGLAAHHLVTALALAVEWRAAVVVLVIPYVWMRLSFAAGNWAQHAFVDAGDPANSFKNTISCVQPDFNAGSFNSGFHIAHHSDLRLHWTELPADLERRAARYRQEQAIVFEGIEYGQVFLALMGKRYRWLASKHMPCGDSLEIIAERLAQRTRRLA
jgi:fatty acid desaturase